MSGEKARLEPHDAACCFEQVLETAPYKTAAVWPLTSCLVNHPSKMKHAGHNWRNKDKLISSVLLYTDIPAKFTFISSVQTLGTV